MAKSRSLRTWLRSRRGDAKPGGLPEETEGLISGPDVAGVENEHAAVQVTSTPAAEEAMRRATVRGRQEKLRLALCRFCRYIRRNLYIK